MLPRLDKLVEECVAATGREPTPSGKKLSKDDCVQLLRQHHMPEGGLPYEELTPMLCFAEWNLKPEEQEKVWTSPNWIAQKKLNGCRAVVHFVAGKGVFIHSRTISRRTYRFQELTQQCLFHDYVPHFSATVDCEVIVEKPVDTRNYTAKGEVTKTSLHSTTSILHLEAENARKIQQDQDAPLIFQAFDITKMQIGDKTADYRKASLEQRLRVLGHFEERLKEEAPQIAMFFSFPEWTKSNKREFFKKVVEDGGEGVILKNLRSPYIDSSSRRRDAWIKVKKRLEFDAFVTGFIRGDADTAWKNLVGALEFSVETDNGRHVIAYCTNLPLESRKKITVYDEANDKVSLNPAVLGKVAEISGQDISARSLRLSHATIDRWRPKDGPDAKRKEQCVALMEDLRAAAAWVG